ncbi:hypothetical protein FBY28_0930 [Arthrobacter sp. SLBN-53]|nr:hypothetical protein FBY28_0930 [Arthrobacter sp. SLBN-53]
MIGTGEVFVRLHYKNPGPDTSNVTLRMPIPPELVVDLSKVRILNGSNLNGAVIANVAPTETGFEVNIGRYSPGSNAFVVFEANLKNNDELSCGDNTLVLRSSYSDSEQNRVDKSNEAKVVYSGWPCVKPTS